jgi:prevent-host-death family protein
MTGHIIVTMKKQTVPAGKFKAECLKLIDKVAATHESVIVTKRGRPVVEVIPVRTRERKSLQKSVTVRGDIVGPILDSWDVER